MAEWLRRWTRNPMGSPRAGSNPARSDNIFTVHKQSMHISPPILYACWNFKVCLTCHDFLENTKQSIFILKRNNFNNSISYEQVLVFPFNTEIYIIDNY